MRVGRWPASLAAVLSLQLAAALRSAGRAGQPGPAYVEEDFDSDLLLARVPRENENMTNLARRLGEDFEQNFGHLVDEAFQHLEAPAVLTVSGYMERLFVNFLLNLRLAAQTNGTQINVVNTLLDPVTLSTCRQMASESRLRQRLKVQCVDLIGMLPDAEGKTQPHSGSFLWAKPVVLHRAVRATRHGVFLADVDVIFYKDLLLWVTRHWRQEPEVVLTVGTEWDSCCNTGTVYAEQARSMPLLDLWLENNNRWFHRRLGDQDALLSLVMHNVSRQLGIATRFKPPFPQGLVNKSGDRRISLFAQEVVIEQGRKCKGCPCRGPCSEGEGPYAKHYNCISMHMQQEHTLRSRGNWSEDVDRFSQTRSLGRMQMMAEEGDWREPEQPEAQAAAADAAGGPGATSRSARGGVLTRKAQ